MNMYNGVQDSYDLNQIKKKENYAKTGGARS